MKPARPAKTLRRKRTEESKLVTLPVRWTVRGTTLRVNQSVGSDLYDFSLDLPASLYQRGY